VIADLDLCPSCLTELPVGYAFDHVAIDRVLAGAARDLFAAMTADERREVVLAGLSRGMTLMSLRDLLSWGYQHLQALLPDEHPDSKRSADARLERRIRQLWSQGITDAVIATELGCEPSKIGRFRRRMGLPTRRNIAQVRREWAA
jgi:hypothetical protein